MSLTPEEVGASISIEIYGFLDQRLSARIGRALRERPLEPELLRVKLDEILDVVKNLRKEERIMANSVQALQTAVAALATQLQGEDAAIQQIIVALAAASPTRRQSGD